MKNTKQNAKIRLYDGAATPYYLELDLDPGDFSGPAGAPLTEEILVLDRGNMTSDAHYIEGTDEKLMEPVSVTFSAIITDAALTVYLLDWLAAMNDNLASTVNGNTLTSTISDSQRDGAVNNPAFADTNKEVCNIEYLITMSGTDLGWMFMEVRFPMDQIQLSEGDDAITVALNGMCYGTITRITSFTAGTSVEA
jgi:hypothetical protein